MEGPVSMLAAQALGRTPQTYPAVALAATASSTAKEHQGQVLTAQGGQLLLFLLTMLLAGMVLSNLVEEKGNKIIEILAAAIPMDAVFLGKLFAMLAVSFVGIATWASAYGAFALLAGNAMPSLPEPAVGWPMFITLGIAYFAMAYLLIGSLFLTIGSMATTVREVQTLSMPVTFVQLVFFFIASFAVAAPNSIYEWVAIARAVQLALCHAGARGAGPGAVAACRRLRLAGAVHRAADPHRRETVPHAGDEIGAIGRQGEEARTAG